jgi:hypothetical protein
MAVFGGVCSSRVVDVLGEPAALVKFEEVVRQLVRTGPFFPAVVVGMKLEVSIVDGDSHGVEV